MQFVRLRKHARVAALTIPLLIACTIAHATDPSTTLAHIRSANILHCGVDIEEAEYSTSDDHGNRAAFDADICHAVAVAVLGSNPQTSITNYPDDAAAADRSPRRRNRSHPHAHRRLHPPGRNPSCLHALRALGRRRLSLTGRQPHHTRVTIDRQKNLLPRRDHRRRKRPRLVYPREFEFCPISFSGRGRDASRIRHRQLRPLWPVTAPASRKPTQPWPATAKPRTCYPKPSPKTR